MWEYSNNHLQIRSTDIMHCCSYDLGGSCKDGHAIEMCHTCYTCRSFFDKVVNGFLQRVTSLKFTDYNHKDELISMINTLPTLTHSITCYMSHRLRAKVQFHAISKIKISLKDNNSNFIIKTPTKVLVVIDHKQKVLQMKYREGQLEYYGKKGMSVLGEMLVYWSHDKSGYIHRFEDYVLKGYSAQDNVQVSSVIQQIVSDIHYNYPWLQEIVFQSDNDSCFSS